MEIGERKSCITGIGQSEINRKPGRPPLALAVDACKAAIDDAGLTIDDIDGISTWPGASSAGFSAAGVSDIKEALNLKLNWFSGGIEAPGQYGSIANAIGAVAAGLARHVLCFRALGERSVAVNHYGQRDAAAGLPRAAGFGQWSQPYWATSAANWVAFHGMSHMHTYGITREQMAAIPITQRHNAGLNPNAVYRDPMTMDDYFNARMVSYPLCLFDCDVPVDGCTAVIVSHVDTAKDLPHPMIRFEAIGTALHGRDSWFQREDFPKMAMHDCTKMLWQRTDLKPKDIDTAHIYDGFTYLTLLWLEALGICGEGESGAFVEGGKRIAIEGDLPLNTNGGQLSEGRMHAYGHLHELVLQLRGDAGERQVKGDPKISITAAGGGNLGTSILLARE